MAKQSAKKSTKRTSKRKASPRAAANPYREGSSYGLVFDLLYANRKTGITRAKLLALLKKTSRKKEKLLGYDISVCVSPSPPPDSSAHRSAKADAYYVDKTDGGFLKLHMRPKNTRK